MDSVAVVLFLALVARFAIGAWAVRGRLAARDRWALLTAFAMAATTFAVASALINWVVVPAAFWLIAVGTLAAGVAGAVPRWPGLAWSTSPNPIRRAIGVGATLATCALIVSLSVF